MRGRGDKAGDEQWKRGKVDWTKLKGYRRRKVDETKDEMKGRLHLDFVIREGTAILELLTNENKKVEG